MDEGGPSHGCKERLLRRKGKKSVFSPQSTVESPITYIAFMLLIVVLLMLFTIVMKIMLIIGKRRRHFILFFILQLVYFFLLFFLLLYITLNSANIYCFKVKQIANFSIGIYCSLEEILIHQFTQTVQQKLLEIKHISNYRVYSLANYSCDYKISKNITTKSNVLSL